jgi:ADP-ribose pyrophosphatase YjhB (NUDIX family)
MVGVGAVMVRDGRILLAKRRSDPEKGKLSVPGGLVELGESLERAVVREVDEETGLSIDRPKLMDVVDSIDVDEEGRIKYHFVIVVFNAVLGDQKIRIGSDAEELRWLTLEAAEQYDLTTSFKEFFNNNRRKLQSLARGC